jgi:ABC-type uncharacterized transport system involved in gliding motility auxiliary subunit
MNNPLVTIIVLIAIWGGFSYSMDNFIKTLKNLSVLLRTDKYQLSDDEFKVIKELLAQPKIPENLDKINDYLERYNYKKNNWEFVQIDPFKKQLIVIREKLFK